MQLLSVGLARSIWLFDVNELNPSGKQIFPDVLTWLGEKYSFQSFPKAIVETDESKSGYQFKNGKFQTDDGPITGNFSIHNDGFIAETFASTEISDQFLSEILRAASSKYGLASNFEPVMRKLYISEVNVRFDHDLSVFGKSFAGFCEKLNGLMTRHNLPKYEMTGMIFAPDTSATSYKPPGFMLERKTNTPFPANRYWSKSPFTTSDHLAALEAYESLLAGEE